MGSDGILKTVLAVYAEYKALEFSAYLTIHNVKLDVNVLFGAMTLFRYKGSKILSFSLKHR